MSENWHFQKSDPKKSSKLLMKLNSLDRSQDKFTPKTSGPLSDTRAVPVSKCSVQEGVRMMVTPSMFMTGKH